MLIFRCFQTLKIWTKPLLKKSREEAKKRDPRDDVESLAVSGRQQKFSGYLWDRSRDKHTQRPSVNTQTGYRRGTLFQLFFFFKLNIWHVGSFTWAHRLSGFSSSSTWTPEILVPWPGIEPVSPVLHGGFLTTGPPGKSLSNVLKGKELKESKLLLTLVDNLVTNLRFNDQ